ncbi:MAG: hypothetical protein H8D56_11000 [Planctomycetes bacterium]|nr:hypothetical protein [Planctomycetota bacterium]MBL7143826.1 hypothetical protein [Phycisphaerae bacterium]
MENYLSPITNYLVAQSWQIALLVVVIAAVNLALKNRSAHIRYLLWLIVLAKCLAPPLLTVPLAVLPQNKITEPVPIPPVQMPAVVFEVTDTPTAETTVSPAIPAVAAPTPTVAERPARFTITTRHWLGFGWLAGVAVFALFAAIKALRTNSWLRWDRKPLPSKLQAGIEDLFLGLGLKTFPKVWLVEGIGQPFVWGLLRGRIYLPADFIKVNSIEHCRDVLSHELGHILRFDAAVNILQVIAQAVFWFHPFVWWANKKIRGEREKCCDEMAIACLGAKAKDYGSAIVEILIAEHQSTRPVPSLAVAGPVKNIEERIKTIMKPGKKFYERPSLIVVTVVLLLSLLTAPTVLVLTARAETSAPVQTGGQSLPQEDGVQSPRFGGMAMTREPVPKMGAIAAAESPVTKLPQTREPASGPFGAMAGRRVGVQTMVEPATTRVLHFPQDQSVGVVYLQDEDLVIPETVKGYHSGYTYAERENFSCARGDVHIPAGKRVILTIRGVGASPERYRTALESLGPDDLHGLEFLFIPALDDDLMPLVARLTGLRRLGLGGVRVSTRGLAPLAQLPQLEELSTPKGMTDAGMAEIAKIQSLKSLDVFHDRMTDEGLRSLGKLASLEVMCLYGNSKMTDDGLKALTQLRSLRHLRLGMEGLFTDRGMDYLAMMPSLKVLWLDTHNVTDEGLRRLSKSRSLERLCICWLDNITDRGIAYLTAMSQLKGLNATHVNLLTNATMAHLATMPNIDDLRLPYRFTDAGINHLANLGHLKYLSVNGIDNSPLTDKALATISNLRQLEELSIGGIGFTNNGIELLQNLENLSTLHIAFWSGLDNETLKQLARLPKLRELSWGSSDSVTMSGLNALNRLAGLESLSVYDIRQDDEGLDLSGLKKLRSLRIMMRHQTTRVGNEVVFTWDAYHDSDLMSLSGLTNLEDLSLTGPGIGDDGFKHLASLTNLKYLQIGGSANLTDDGLIHLANMRRLDSLFIGDSRITERGLAHLYPLKTLHIIQINSAIPIGGQAIARLRTELPHLQSLDISQPKPPARRPRTSKSRVGGQAGSAKPDSARTRNSTRRRR